MAYERKKVLNEISKAEKKELEKYSQGYIDFLSLAKTERLACKEIVKAAQKSGYVELDKALEKGVKTGDKVYAVNNSKAVVLVKLGEDLSEGLDIVGSHIDSPRLDLKPLPFDEAGNMAYMKTHYYGGVKKYLWTNIPLALHGVAFRKDGTKVEISIGEKDTDPVFYINDLLIHLSRKRLELKGTELIEGEQLQIVIGSDGSGADKDQKEPVKAKVLEYLKKEYGLEEEDFQIAEIEAVPAGRAREVGFDRSLIAGHGHDDRICSYANLKAMLDSSDSKRTKVALFVDKEEIGSVGNTGMHSDFFVNVIAELINSMKGSYSELDLKRALSNSRVLSADVTVAFDPMFPEVCDKLNTAVIGGGVSINKYTGSGGKGGCNDANAEFLNQVRRIFDEAGIIWQTGELGKVDAGGGGTIAYILARYGAQVVDCGTGMLSMHAPIELAAKADAFETYRAYKAFFNA